MGRRAEGPVQMVNRRRGVPGGDTQNSKWENPTKGLEIEGEGKTEGETLRVGAEFICHRTDDYLHLTCIHTGILQSRCETYAV